MTGSSSYTAKSKKNPYQQWLDHIQRVMKQQDATGWITVRCTDELDSEAYHSDDEDSTTYTQQEVDYIRCIVIPPDRERAIEEMKEFILGDQYDGHSLKLFNPSSFASNVLSAFQVMEKEFKNKRLWHKKLDILFGFTLILSQYNSWMEVMDGRMEDMVHEMYHMWSRVLKKSSEDLAIDDEFSRPGIEYLFMKFKDSAGIEL